MNDIKGRFPPVDNVKKSLNGGIDYRNQQQDESVFALLMEKYKDKPTDISAIGAIDSVLDVIGNSMDKVDENKKNEERLAEEKPVKVDDSVAAFLAGSQAVIKKNEEFERKKAADAYDKK